jgi:hypothetical protein
MKKNLNQIPKLKKGSRKKSILIGCEDSVSAPTYFNSFLKKLLQKGKITKDSRIIPHSGKTNPSGVLEDFILYRSKKGKSFKDYDYKWIVIDRDKEFTHGAGHSKEDFEETILKAKKLNIKVAYSNPSYELWYLLHFRKQNTPLNRYQVIDEVIQELKKLNPYKFRHLARGNIKTQKVTKKIAKEIKRYKTVAIKNALYLKALHSQEGKQLNPENDNPLTNIDALIILFDKLSK